MTSNDNGIGDYTQLADALKDQNITVSPIKPEGDTLEQANLMN